MVDHARDPCPVVILSDFGGAFAMGAIGGAIWHGVKGARNSPKGERLIGAITATKARAPVLGGNFGVWGGLFSTFECVVKDVRGKEDGWNPILSGFCVGGALAIRGGWKQSLGSAVACGMLLGIIEGVGMLISKTTAERTAKNSPILQQAMAQQAH